MNFEERQLTTVIRRMKETLEHSGYKNIRYESSDLHAHYFQYESLDNNGESEVWDLQVEIEGVHEINHKPLDCEDWYFVGETFQELMECHESHFDIAV